MEGVNKVMRGRTVGAILSHVRITRPIRRAELQNGDRLFVVTENSTYTLTRLEDTTFSVRGGWFDRQGLSPVRTSIAGCTWGGSVIKVDIVAAYGLCLEFGNRVLTSRIRAIQVIRASDAPAPMEPADPDELLQTCYGAHWQDSAAS